MEKGVYVIINNVAKEVVTDIYSCNNDAMACYGFASYLAKACKDEIKDTIFSLKRIGSYDSDSGELILRDQAYIVARGKEECRNVIANAEEEDFD